MSLDEAIEQAKIQEQEKEAISLKVPAYIKQKLQAIAEENNVSMNNLISSILSDVLNGSVSNNSYELYQEFKKVSNDITEVIEFDNPQHGFNIDGFSFKPSVVDHNHDFLVTLVDRYKVLKNILGASK